MSISFSGAKKYKKHNGFSASQSIKTPLPSPVCIYNLAQREDIILKPLVKKDEYVLAGQKIADLDTFGALPVFSAVSGKAASVSENKIIIENDMLSRHFPAQIPDKSPNDLTTRERLWILREKGVFETRTGVPAHIMLSPDRIPDCVIVCCFDSDPYISSVQSAAINNTGKILKGLNIVLNILGTKKAIIGVENDTRKIFSDFKYHLRYNTAISLYSLKARYPQSNDAILTKTLTGRDINKINAPIFSPETLCNISDAFETGRPVTTKIVTVSGDDILAPNNYHAPMGVPISSLLINSGYTSPRIVINGGIIDGRRVTDLDEPVDFLTKAVIAFNDKNNIPKYRKEPI